METLLWKKIKFELNWQYAPEVKNNLLLKILSFILESQPDENMTPSRISH